MKINVKFSKSVFFMTFLLMCVSSISMATSDEDKLKELEKAMIQPATSTSSTLKKPRTRAIVFDAAPTTTDTAAGAISQTNVASQPDCSALPHNVSLTAVDFPIQFKVASAEVAPSSEAILIQISKILSLSPKRCVLVEGHTDVSGSYAGNVALSQERANSVVKFITVKAGMDMNRFVPLGKGSSELLKNIDPRSPLHRRVVFKVVG